MTTSEPLGEFSIGGDLWPGLSKFIEEGGEVNDILPELLLQKTLGKALQTAGKIVGNEGRPDHWDGSHLPTRLTEELGDLQAAMLFLIRRNRLSVGAVDERCCNKLAMFEMWHRETQERRAAI